MKRFFVFILVVILLMACQNLDNTRLKKGLKNMADNQSSIPVGLPYDEQLEDVFRDAADISNIRNLSVTFEGRTLRREFYNLCQPQSKNNIFSDTKSISSLLIGIAIDQGYITDVHDFVKDYLDLEDYKDEANVDGLTIHHLLTMGSGLEWDTDLGLEYRGLKASNDPLKYILDRGFEFDLGMGYNYSDGSAYLISELLFSATGKMPLEYAQINLFSPLGIEEVRWSSHKNGVNYGGFDLHLSADDMIKIGQLVLNGGVYKDQQIVSEEWIALSTSEIVASPSTASHNNYYGYFWWVGEKYNHKIISAVGHGGQFITLVPDLNLIVTSSTIGAVADAVSFKQFSDMEFLIINRLIPIFDIGE